jgi:hypothetical protein
MSDYTAASQTRLRAFQPTAQEDKMTLQDAYKQIREHCDATGHGDFRISLGYDVEVNDEHRDGSYAQAFVDEGWVNADGSTPDASDLAPDDGGLTWDHGDPWLFRAVRFAVLCCFHNDVDVHLTLERATNLRTGAVRDHQYVNEHNPCHDCGPPNFRT